MDTGQWLANCHVSFSLILAWLVCQGPGEVLLPVRLMDGNAFQKSFYPVSQKPAFKKKIGLSDSAESWASPVEKAVGGSEGSWRGKKCWFYLFDLLGLISVNSQGSYFWCHLNYFLCKEKKVRQKVPIICTVNRLLFSFLRILLIHKANYIPSLFP